MSYLQKKKQAKDELIKEVKDQQEKGEQVKIGMNLWCEFCMQPKKRWNISLLGKDNIDKVKEEFIRKALLESGYVLACDECINENDLKPLKNDTAAEFDGQKEALKELFHA